MPLTIERIRLALTAWEVSVSKLLAASIAALMLAATAGAAGAQSGSSGPSGSGTRGASPSAPPATTSQPRATNPAPGNSQLSNPATGLPGTRPDAATGLPGTRPGGTSTNPSQQLAPGLPPPAATVQPAPQQDSVSPLSPQVPPPAAFSGGSARQGSLALSPGSETSPSAPGGGGKTLADCMGFWELATHMTKQEWKGACQRTIGRLNR